MALPRRIEQREWDRFVEGGDGYSKVATQLEGLSNTNSGLLSLASAGFGQRVPAAALANRRSVIYYNSSPTTVWLGGSSLASGTGIPMDAGESISIDSYDNIYLCPVYAGQIINYLELS